MDGLRVERQSHGMARRWEHATGSNSCAGWNVVDYFGNLCGRNFCKGFCIDPDFMLGNAGSEQRYDGAALSNELEHEWFHCEYSHQRNHQRNLSVCCDQHELRPL